MPTSSESIVSVGLSSQPVVGPSPKRKALIFSCPTTNRITISIASTAVLDSGINLYPAERPFKLTWSKHGDLVRRAWQGIAAVGAQTIAVYEVFD